MVIPGQYYKLRNNFIESASLHSHFGTEMVHIPNDRLSLIIIANIIRQVKCEAQKLLKVCGSINLYTVTSFDAVLQRFQINPE